MSSDELWPATAAVADATAPFRANAAAPTGDTFTVPFTATDGRTTAARSTAGRGWLRKSENGRGR